MFSHVARLIMTLTSGVDARFSARECSMSRIDGGETQRRVACEPQDMFKLIPGTLKKKKQRNRCGFNVPWDRGSCFHRLCSQVPLL